MTRDLFFRVKVRFFFLGLGFFRVWAGVRVKQQTEARGPGTPSRSAAWVAGTWLLGSPSTAFSST